MLLFETAGNIWGEYLKDDVQVNLHVGMVEANQLPQGVIGGALPGVKSGQAYQDFRAQYQQDITSYDDQDGYKTFKKGGAEYEFKIPEPGDDDDDTWTHEGDIETLDITRANAKALGLDVANAKGLDGYIVLSNLKGTGIRWDEGGDRQNRLSSDDLEMLSVALHEIGHVLGFVSTVDTPNWVKNIKAGSNWQATKQQMDALAQTAMPLDFFRYVDDGSRFDLSYGDIGGRKFFAVDQGDDSLAEFATGVEEQDGGDGYQASHWKRNGKKSVGIMDPALALGERGEISTIDLRMFDMIGWDLAGEKGRRSKSSKTYKQVKLLKTFQKQYQAAEQSVAQRLGLSVGNLRHRPEAAKALTQNREREVFEMLVESQIYDLSWRNWRSWGSRSFWEVLGNAFQARGLYSTVETEQPWLLDAPTMSMPNRDAITGLASDEALTSVANDGWSPPVTPAMEPRAVESPRSRPSLNSLPLAAAEPLALETVLPATQDDVNQADPMMFDLGTTSQDRSRRSGLWPRHPFSQSFSLGRSERNNARSLAAGLNQDQLMGWWASLGASLR